MMKQLYSAGALLALLLMVGCSSNETTVEANLGIKNAPEWVNKGTQAVDNDDGRLIHGVGMAPVMGDVSLQKSTADNRARAEIARVMKTYVNAVVNDYTASASGEADMSVQRTIETTTQLALSGAKILGHWKDESTGDIYAFAELDVKSLDELVSKSDNLAESFKSFYSQNNDIKFERFTQ